jgi:hypothetical protein
MTPEKYVVTCLKESQRLTTPAVRQLDNQFREPFQALPQQSGSVGAKGADCAMCAQIKT